jgi:isoquinoline 1-oxidoreductase subunit beta
MLPVSRRPTHSNKIPATNRRRFIKGAAAVGAGLTIGFDPRSTSAQVAGPPANPGPNPFEAYVRIGTDNTVTVHSAHMDMGQGCYHGLATLVAEELDSELAQMRAEGAAGNTALYGNVAWGGIAQGTGGSTAIASSWERYRQAGATARAMLVSAAARAWNIAPNEVRVERGMLIGPGGQRASFGEFAVRAAREPVPQQVTLKQPKDWQLIGSTDYRRIDSAAKSTGREMFTLDVRLPGMLTAVVAHPPLFGATVKSFDDTAARRVPGVVEVVRISRGIAVVAANTWAAMQGREALKVEWDETRAEKRSSRELMAEYRALSERPGTLAAERGDAEAALARAARLVEATYEFPYLAHAALEPLDAVARFSDGTLEVWGGHQMPDLYQAASAQIAGITPDKVRMHVMKTGGGFGRRAVMDADVIVEAVETAKALNWRAPVKVVWTREDDMTGGRYRPMMLHKVRVGLGADGTISGWHHRIVGQSILIGTAFEQMLVKNGVDATSVEGVSDTEYGLNNFRAEVHNTSVGVPVLWWRSVGHTHTGYVMETMLDRVARETRKDPVALRRELLRDKPRHLAVLNMAAEKAGWSSALAGGRFRGIALHESFGTVVAQVAEIVMGERGQFKVDRVVAAVDCGVAVNPDVVRAQVEGGVGFGLGAILHEEIVLGQGGRVEQTNFDTYRPLRLDEMPRVEVHIVPSTATPSGIGEPGVPPIGPAVANAYAAATGRWITALPIEKGLGS